MMDLKQHIKLHEGLRLKPYRCTAGKITIGVGRNLSDRGISTAEAEILLDADIAIAKQDLFYVFGPQVAEFSKNRHGALTDMMFNLGVTRFRGFKKMIDAIKKENWTEASRQALDSKWAEQVKTRATRDSILLLEG